MIRRGSKYVSDRNPVVRSDAEQGKEANRAIRIGRELIEFNLDLQSDNYVPGSSGWQLTRDGDVEFNTGTFRGELNAGGAGDVVISGTSGLEIREGDTAGRRVGFVEPDGTVRGSIQKLINGPLQVDSWTDLSLTAVNRVDLSSGLTPRSQGSPILTEATHDHNTGYRTTHSLDWSATGTNGSTSTRTSLQSDGDHKHEVPYHTHTIDI